VDLLASAVAASAAIYVFASLFFAFAFVRRQSESEHGVFALMCLALAESAAGALLGMRGGSARAVLLGEQVSWVGLVGAFAMLVHYGLHYRGVKNARVVLVPVYFVAAVLEALNARGLLHDVARVGEHRVWLRGVEYYGTPLSPAGIVAYALGGIAVTSVLVLVARAYLAGKREALAVVIGTTALLATVINDVGVASGAFSTTYLVDAGFVAFVFSVSTTYSSRYSAL